MSTETSKFQIETGVDPSGIQDGMQAVEQAVIKTERTVTDSSARTGKAIGAIGDQAAKGADKADKSLGNLTASIQRYNAQLESGGQKGAKYFESLADSRGLDKTNEAFQAAIAKSRELEAQNQKLGVSAAQTAAAMRGVPAQFTDIVTSLQGGQAPMTVLLQQGGQLKDMFGGTGNAAKALGGYIMGLVNPLTVTAAAAAAVGYAFYSGSKESSEFTKTLLLTGNQAGVTTGQLMAMAAAVSAVGGTQGNAADVLNQLAATGKVTASGLQDAAQAAVAFERAGGQAAGETVKAFAELGKAPLEASLKLNESMGYLTKSTYAQIKALMDQGRETEAASVAQKAFADALGSRSGEMVKNLGLVEKSWAGIKGAVTGAWDAIKSIGRDVGVEGQASATSSAISRLEAQIASRRQGGYNTQLLDAELGKLRERQSILQSDARLMRAAAGVQAEQVRLTKATAEWDKEGEKYLSKQAQMQREITKARAEGLAAQRSQIEIEARIAGIREKYKETGTGQDAGEAALAKQKATLEEAKQYAINLQRELAAVMAGDTSGFAKQTQAEKTAIELQAQLATGIKGVARANMEKQLAVALDTVEVEKSNRVTEKQIQIQKDLEKQRAAELKALGADAVSIQARADALNAELGVRGKSKAAIEEGVLARMKENAADVAMFDNSDDVVAAINAKIKAQEALVNAIKATDYDAINQHSEELLRSAQEQQKLYQDELQLTGLTAVERSNVVAQRAIELKYAKELDALDKSGLSDTQKETQRLKIAEAKRIESAAATGKVIQAEYERVSNQIEQSLTDALMRGFESGKGFAKNLRDTVVNMFKTLVLRPIVQAVVQTGMGYVGFGPGGSAGGGGGGIPFASGAGYYNSFATSSAGQYMGLSTPGTVDVMGDGVWGSSPQLTPTGQAVGSWANTAGQAIGYGNAIYTAFTPNAQGGRDYGSAAGQAIGTYFGGPIGGHIGGQIGSALGIVDYGGTYHTGGIGSYSAAGGTRTGASALTGGMTFGLEAKDYSAAGEQAAAGFARGIVGILDSTATTFGRKAGYEVGTAFADDISPDGSWGALFIKLGESTLVDWKDGQDKWPGREFADGDAGLKEYQAAVAKDVRDYLITQTPQWADDMLTALGDSPTIDQLATTVADINAAAVAFGTFGMVAKNFASIGEESMAALVKAMGGAKDAAAALGSYYSLFYTDDERKGLTKQQTTAKIAALGVKDIPTTRAEYRAFVNSIDLTTTEGRKLYASMIALAPAFASYTDEVASATDVYKAAMAEVAKAKEEAEKQQNAALKNLETAIAREKQLYQAQADAAQEAADAMQGLFDMLKGNVDELRGNVGSTAAMSATAGNAYIDQALGNYKSTGYLPDQAGLSDAISAARGGINPNNFGTSLEYERAQLILANKLDDLKLGAEEQKTVAQRTLESAKRQVEQLDITLEYWKQQVALAQGGIDATMSVTDAVNALAALFDKSKTPAGSGGKTTGGGGGSGTFTTGLGGIPANAKPFSKEDVYASVIAELNTKGVYAANWRWIDGIGGGMAGYDRITDPGLIAQYDAIRDYGQQLYESQGGGEAGAWAVYNAAMANGVSSAEVATSFGMTPDQLQGYLDMYGIPSFAVGTNRILEDGLAYLHKNEAVVPAAYNPALAGNQPGQGTEQLRAENAALRSSLAEMNSLMARIAKATEKTERAMTNVTEGGSGMVLSTPVLAL